MTARESEVFPEVKNFLEYMARACKGCFYRNSKHCESCPASTAQRLLDKMGPKAPFEEPISTLERRSRKILAFILSKGGTCTAHDIPLSAGCSKNLRSMVLKKLVESGRLVRIDRVYPSYRYSIPEVAKKKEKS
jgi:hypothetical protein